MQALIEENVEAGSHIHSDGWRAYQSINWERLGMTHERHIHVSRRGLERRTMAHSNLIEGLWGVLKYHIKHVYNTLPGSDNLEAFLYEALWRREFTRISKKSE